MSTRHLFLKSAATPPPAKPVDMSVPAADVRPTDYFPKLRGKFGDMPSLGGYQMRGLNRSLTPQGPKDHAYAAARDIPGHPIISGAMNLLWQLYGPKPRPEDLGVAPYRAFNTYVPAPYQGAAAAADYAAVQKATQPPSLGGMVQQLLGPPLAQGAAAAGGHFGM